MNDFETALSKAMKFCSTKETCKSEMIQKLELWNISSEHFEKILSNLISENFIDENRFAFAFANDKLKFNNWGKKKIYFELIKKKVDKSSISYALNNIPEELYFNTAEKLINTKLKTLKNTDKKGIKNKILSYMLSKGFESELILSILKNQK